MADPWDLLERIRKLKEQARGVAHPEPNVVDALIREIHRKRALIQTLDLFLQQIYTADDLSPAVSRQNIEESVIELLRYGQHTSNGLLITNDGYFLTAKHCVDREEHRPEEVRLHDGRRYPFEKAYVYLPGTDLALAKAAIPGECTPRNYRFYNTNVLDKVPAEFLTCWDGRLIRSSGSVSYTNMIGYLQGASGTRTVSQFGMEIYGRRGCSGSPVIEPREGRVLGILCGGSDEHVFATGAKWIDALKLVDHYKRRVERDL